MGIDIPSAGSIADVASDGMSDPLLVEATGTATAENATTDFLADGIFGMNVPIATGPLTVDNVMSCGMPADLTATTMGTLGIIAADWDASNRLNAVGTANPAANNNSLYVAVGWRRDSQNGDFPNYQLLGPVNYKGQLIQALAPLAAARVARAGAGIMTSDIQADGHDGRALLFRKVPAKTPRDGHRLVDGCGDPLRASRIAVHAFDVHWCYTHFGHTPPAKHPVRRAVGDSLEVGPGTYFLSPHNSLIIWQANWRTRRRTVILSETRFQPDIIELDPTQDIYVHVNYHRTLPLKICGHFGLSVTLDP